MEAQLVNDLEDGEIDDEDEGLLDDMYTPLERTGLERPAPVSHVPNPCATLSDSEDAMGSSDSSSDSDHGGRRRRRPRAKAPRRLSPTGASAKHNKYAVWCAGAAEDVLSHDLVHCNVARGVYRSRDVESYDPFVATRGITLKSPVHTNKRNHTGEPMGPAMRRLAQPEPQAAARHILPLTCTADASPEDLARDIANRLLEDKETIVWRMSTGTLEEENVDVVPCLIAVNAIQALGKEKAIEIFEETVHVESNGGLLILNGTRRRTPGGVYFFLLKSAYGLDSSQMTRIFGDDRRQTAQEVKKSRTAQRKEALNREDYPTLLSRAEAAILQLKEAPTEVEEEVKNPPPSPANSPPQS